MKKLTKSLTVPTLIVCALGWSLFFTQATNSKEDATESDNVIRSFEDIKKNSITYQFEESYKNIRNEYERLKEEERKRLEKIRLAKIEEEKRLAEQKKRQQEQVVSRGSNNVSGSKAYYEVTFYTAGVESTGKSKGDPYYGVTASGTSVMEGRTVACPKSLPFGTKLHIEGFGYRVCEDRGGAITTGRLDIYVDSLSKARKLGNQKLLVTVLN